MKTKAQNPMYRPLTTKAQRPYFADALDAYDDLTLTLQHARGAFYGLDGAATAPAINREAIAGLADLGLSTIDLAENFAAALFEVAKSKVKAKEKR
jgi:hypothetical protein